MYCKMKKSKRETKTLQLLLNIIDDLTDQVNAPKVTRDSSVIHRNFNNNSTLNNGEL